MRIILTTIFLFLSVCASAAIPTCHENSGGNYCSYKGMVDRIYMNDAGLILIYFDTQLPIETAGAVGLSVTYGNAGSYLLSSNPEFAKILYSTALSAKAAGLPITLQMRGNQSGYLKIDRFWL